MDKVWIISFNEQMEIKVYKCWGYLHDKINNEIIDENGFVSIESSSQKSWRESYDWCLVRKVQD